MQAHPGDEGNVFNLNSSKVCLDIRPKNFPQVIRPKR
jgi:hypothetical protein